MKDTIVGCTAEILIENSVIYKYNCKTFALRRVWRYQRGIQNPNIEEEQWPKRKSTKGQTT